jgi:hypothetical protein
LNIHADGDKLNYYWSDETLWNINKREKDILIIP